MLPTAYLLNIAIVVLAMSFIPSTARAQTISDLERDEEEFHDQATDLYRLDKDNLNYIWEMYCGEFDQGDAEDKEYAAVIGRELQNKTKELVENYLGLADDLQERAEAMISNGQSTKRATEVLNRVRRQEEKLQKLNDGAILSGSNHPFVQFATEYGKKKHLNMCDEYKETGRVCDREFSGANGRPDLVTVDNGVLMIYEFKPNNSKARDKGWDQVKRYIAPVVAYYQNFLPDGPSGAVDRSPSGEDALIVQALQNSSKAWNGKYLQASVDVKTYDICDNPFD